MSDSPCAKQSRSAPSAPLHADGRDAFAAADVQILSQMTALFEREPATIENLLNESTASAGGHVAMIYAAARAALENQPDSPALHVHAAAAALRMGDSPTAERLLERAVKLAPDDPRAWLLFAEASVIRNRPARARRCAQRARALGAPSPATRGS